ncbi:MAG: hypothetical protein PHG06_13320 [Parabacteroides sp.]|nr:hypothetical protein [Parabacteroides sp.]
MVMLFSLIHSSMVFAGSFSESNPNQLNYGYAYNDSEIVSTAVKGHLHKFIPEKEILTGTFTIHSVPYIFLAEKWEAQGQITYVSGQFDDGKEKYRGEIAFSGDLKRISGNIAFNTGTINFIVADSDAKIPSVYEFQTILESESNLSTMAVAQTNANIRAEGSGTEIYMQVIGSPNLSKSGYQNYHIRSGLTNPNYNAPIHVVRENRNYLTPKVVSGKYFGVSDVAPKKPGGSSSTWNASITFAYAGFSTTVNFSSTSTSSDYFAAGTSSTQASYVINKGVSAKSAYYWTGDASASSGIGGNFSLKLPSDATVGLNYSGTAKAEWEIYSVSLNMYFTRTLSKDFSVKCVA